MLWKFTAHLTSTSRAGDSTNRARAEIRTVEYLGRAWLAEHHNASFPIFADVMPATWTFVQTSLLLWSGFMGWTLSSPLRRAECPGYRASNVRRTDHGVTADLTLAGPGCNLYSNDLKDLKFLAQYQTGTL